MEVLDICNDQNWSDWDSDGENGEPKLNPEDDETSDSDSDSEGSNFLPDFLSKGKKRSSTLSEDGKRGTLDQFRDYKQHNKQLHRKNKGLMQWKGPRTLAWMKHVAERGTTKVTGAFKHKDRAGQGIETEV